MHGETLLIDKGNHGELVIDPKHTSARLMFLHSCEISHWPSRTGVHGVHTHTHTVTVASKKRR